MDDSLNVYATGGQSIAFDTNAMVIVKYNSSGTEKWKSYYCQNSLHTDYGYRLALDEIGNLYVAGDLTSAIVSNNINEVWDGHFLAKYTPSGQRLWIKEIPRNYFVNGAKCHLKVINSNLIYVGFLRYISNLNYVRGHFAKFNSGGDTVWTRIIQNQKPMYAFNAFEIDNLGNLLCGGAANSTSEFDAALFKYDPAGILSWDRFSNSVGFGLDKAINIGKDNQNNIYVTGMNAYDYLFIKYNSSFNQQWAVTYSDGSTRDESYTFSAVDSTGNIYLTGTTKDSLGSRYIILLKYNTNGSLEWQRKYSSVPAQSWGLCIDRTGNIVIAGTNNDANNHSALNLIKYSPAGALLMTTSFNAQNNSNIWVNSFEVDNDNNFLIAGNSYGSMIWKFKNNGTYIWGKYITGTYVNILNKVKFDKKNNVYVCGVTGTGSGYDYISIKYDSSGNQKWQKTFNGARNNDDMAQDLAVDTLGNTYVTGYACNQPANYDRSIVTIKYDSAGNALWLKDFRSIPNGYLTPVMISKDRFNNIYVLTGYYYYQPAAAGYLTVKYNQNGDSIWSYTYTSSLTANFGKSMLFVNDNKFYITGRAYGVNTGYDITTLEIMQTTGIRNSDENIPSSYSLFQNYPNPFNPTTNIKFKVASYKVVKLIVFDLLGREIQTLVNEKLKPGEYEVTFDGTALTSGVYFYKLTAGDFTETKKMLMIK